MAPTQVCVVSLSSHVADAERCAAELAQAAGEFEIDFIATDAENVENHDPARIAATVLLSDGLTEWGGLRALLAYLEDLNVPMIVIDNGAAPLRKKNHYSFAGALVVPSSEMQSVLPIVRGVAHRQPTVRRLRSEVDIAQRFHGGLQGEIAKMHEELQLAAMVQREYLPRELPSLCGVEMAVMWRPTNYVSGDIYDATRLDEDHIGVFLADAVGHGVPAALMTMVICRSLNTKEIKQSSYRIIEPSEVLGRLNQEMIRRKGRTTRFATAVYAVINCRDRTVRLAGAGHPPPLLFGADGSAEMMKTNGGLLGVFDDEEYDQIEFELAADDQLLLYSDGFEQAFPSEVSDDDDRLPSERYLDVFRGLSTEPSPQAFIDSVGACVDGQEGSLHQLDDLTLIAIGAGALEQAECDEVEPVAETEANYVNEPRV